MSLFSLNYSNIVMSSQAVATTRQTMRSASLWLPTRSSSNADLPSTLAECAQHLLLSRGSVSSFTIVVTLSS